MTVGDQVTYGAVSDHTPMQTNMFCEEPESDRLATAKCVPSRR